MVTLVTGAAADVTGILLATALAVGGFYILPRKRRRAQQDFQRRISELQVHLKDVLTRQVHLELEQATGRINEAIAPYRRFVHSQQQRLNEAGWSREIDKMTRWGASLADEERRRLLGYLVRHFPPR